MTVAPSPAAVPLAHDRVGSGEPLVLVHALGADRGVWTPVIDRLAARHDVVAMDMPGFGESEELPADVDATPTAIAASIVATLDSLGIESAHVAGISLGGWVSLEFGKTGRALSVTTLCAAGFWPRPLGPRPETARRIARTAVPLLRGVLGTGPVRRVALAGVVAHPERVPAADAYRLLRAYAVSTGFDRANAEMRKTLFSGFDEIHVPVTMAWGERDRLVAPPRPRPTGVTMELLADCGHVPTWDDPERVSAVILEGAARGSFAG